MNLTTFREKGDECKKAYFFYIENESKFNTLADELLIEFVKENGTETNTTYELDFEEYNQIISLKTEDYHGLYKVKTITLQKRDEDDIDINIEITLKPVDEDKHELAYSYFHNLDNIAKMFIIKKILRGVSDEINSYEENKDPNFE